MREIIGMPFDNLRKYCAVRMIKNNYVFGSMEISEKIKQARCPVKFISHSMKTFILLFDQYERLKDILQMGN